MNSTGFKNYADRVVNIRSSDRYDVYIGRGRGGAPTVFGNPFAMVAGDASKSREAVVSEFESFLLHNEGQAAQLMRDQLHTLRGKKLGCFCGPLLCHGHVLSHHAENLAPGQSLPLGGIKERLTLELGSAKKVLSNPSVGSIVGALEFVGYARYPVKGVDSFECSSQGDKRFSALFARFKSGENLESVYQLDVKGYRALGNDWRLGKGKPPLRPVADLYGEYKALWNQYLDENEQLVDVLKQKAKNRCLTDRFASSPISQARALAEIAAERFGWTLVSGRSLSDLATSLTIKKVQTVTEPPTTSRPVVAKEIDHPVSGAAKQAEQLGLFDVASEPPTQRRFRP